MEKRYRNKIIIIVIIILKSNPFLNPAKPQLQGEAPADLRISISIYIEPFYSAINYPAAILPSEMRVTVRG